MPSSGQESKICSIPRHMNWQSQENETLTSHRTYLFGNTAVRISTPATFDSSGNTTLTLTLLTWRIW